jgi:nucleoside-diphosphate-sugar epimerase
MEKVPDNQKNIWVFGGTGFIGHSLVNDLAGDSSLRINLLVHKHIPYPYLEKFNTVTGSLTSFDLSWLETYPPAVIFHLARLAGGSPLRRRIAALRGEKANERLAGYLKNTKKPPVVIYVSGSLMYGNQADGESAGEDSPIDPVAFGRDYIRAERPWMGIPAGSLPRVKIVRPGWIVGPGSWFRAFFWNHYLSTGRVPVYGDGHQLMSLIHVDDLGKMISRVPECAPGVLNLFSGNPLTQLEFSNILADLLGADKERIPLDQVARRWGKTEASAMGSSVPLTTRHPEIWTGFDFSYPAPEDMLKAAILSLKGEKRVFAEPPQGGAVQELIGQQ